ncbi:MAG: hypothetical protein LBD92_07235 [Oscillospiraceae bacterium]|jgi:ABC-type sugar transport system substrate-binding protein|nr:hypothetical protein [Oscillospiraceae bacterium]
MKKVLALILIFAMVVSLFACGKTETESRPEASPGTVGTPPSSGGESAAAPTGASEPTHVGYWDDPVDHFSREPYRAVFYQIYSNEAIDWQYRALQYLGKNVMNVEFEFFNANGDNEKFINSLDLYADRDGIILTHNYAAQKRVLEVLREYGDKFDWLNVMTPFQDDATQELYGPAVVIDGYEVGKLSTQWLIDNYRSYWGEVDPSKIGYIFLNLSTVNVFRPREQAARDVWTENFPDNLMLVGDASGQQITAELVYNMVTSYTTGHPEVEYWFINCAMLMFPAPAARAIETLGMTDRALITCCESQGVTTEWDAGSVGALVSCVGASEDLLTAPALSGLVALMDGRATQETLWEDARQEKYGGKYSMYPIPLTILTPDNYIQYNDDVAAEIYGDASLKPRPQ